MVSSKWLVTLLALIESTDGFVLRGAATVAATRSHIAGPAISMGVQVKTITQAPAGAVKPKNGDIVLCHYTGYLRTKLGTKGKQFGARQITAPTHPMAPKDKTRTARSYFLRVPVWRRWVVPSAVRWLTPCYPVWRRASC